MSKFAIAIAALAVAGFAGGQAVAGNTDDGTKLTGPHYNLNIIGVENAKKSDMTGSNRHTIFVPLESTEKGNVNSKGQFDESGDPVAGTAIVDSQIWLTPGEEFRVCDGNGFDLAYGCPDGNFDETWNTTVFNDAGDPVPLVDRKEGAVFMLPCNTNIDQTADVTTNCDQEDPQAHYSVWVRGLGKPGGNATVTTCATVEGELYCSLENEVITRSKGKSEFTEVTDELTSLLISFCDGTILVDGSCDGTVTTERFALFAGLTEDWFWNYDNNGLRLAQLRFYEVAQQ